jgi:hypothetical protein
MSTQLLEVSPETLSSRMQQRPPAELMSVTKRYGATLALSDLSFSVAPGELVALLGANGAGKTTAVRLLLGLAKSDSGLARVFGDDPRLPRTRARTGAMLQVARVPETIRVGEHITLFSSYYPQPIPLADVLEAASLQGLAARPYGELSGGQKQRLRGTPPGVTPSPFASARGRPQRWRLDAAKPAGWKAAIGGTPVRHGMAGVDGEIPMDANAQGLPAVDRRPDLRSVNHPSMTWLIRSAFVGSDRRSIRHEEPPASDFCISARTLNPVPFASLKKSR